MSNCDGGYETDALNHMKNTGIVNETCFPYTISDSACSNKCSNWQNLTLKISNYGLADANTTTIKQTINDYGSVTVFMYADSDLSSYASGIYNHSSVTWGGGYHVVSIVGYNDTGSYWICKNSWGTSWGESGFLESAILKMC